MMQTDANPCEELHRLSSALSSTSLSVKEKQDNLKVIRDKFVSCEYNLAGGGGYISLHPNSRENNCIYLPNLEWSHLRKGYTILAWIRPNKNISDIDEECNDSILYRLSHGEKVGVSASLSKFKCHSNENISSCQLQVQTFSYGLSSFPSSSSENSFPSKTASVTLNIPTDSYSLLTISHTHPYLKRPQIFISINHQTQLKSELHYPFSSQNSSTKNIYQETNIVLTNNILFKNLSISCSMLSIFKESLIKDESDIVFSNLISDAGPSASILLCKSGILVPPVPPQRDVMVQSISKKYSSSAKSLSSSSRGFHQSSTQRRPLGTPISVHPKSVELQNFLSRNLLVLYDFETTHILTSKEKIYVPPCKIKNIGSVENIGWVTYGILQRKDSIQNESKRRSKNSHANQLSSLSISMDGSCAKHHTSYLSSSSTSSLSTLHASSIANSTVLYTSGLLLSLLLPFHLALYPERMERLVVNEKSSVNRTSTPIFLQPKLHSQRQIHLKALLNNQGEYAMNLLVQIAKLLDVSWFCREEALQIGLIYCVATYTTKLLEELENDASVSIHEKKHCSNNIERGLLQIVKVCCGTIENEDPIRRTSDLALACVFGLVLNFRILPYFSISITSKHFRILSYFSTTGSTSNKEGECMTERNNLILEHVAKGYEYYGDILRAYYSPQILLDQIQIYFPLNKWPYSSEIASHFELLLKALLQSSLSSTTDISRSEIDIQTCVQTLTNTKLGSLASKIVLKALNGLKSRRLARNLWIGDFPKVIGPVLLSRAVVKGEEVDSNHISSDNNEDNIEWREQWRDAFELFLWLASISRSELHSSFNKSFGKLLSDSGKAGSLDKCVNEEFARRLFEVNEKESILFSPMSFEEQDFLRAAHTNRIQALLPLLPGLVTSLVAPYPTSNPKTPKDHIVPTLITLLGGVNIALKQFIEAKLSKHQASHTIKHAFFNIDNRSDADEFSTTVTHEKTMEWIFLLLSVIDLLQAYEADNHTDWIDVNHTNNNVQTKEFQITSPINLVSDSLSTLLMSSMYVGGKTTVAALQAIKTYPQLTQVIFMTLNRCIRIVSSSFSESMSAGVARLCVFMDEHPELKWEEISNMTLVEILKRGREESGWYQITNTTVPVPSNAIQIETNDERATLTEKITQFVDDALMQTPSGIYHTFTDNPTGESKSLSSFERGGLLFLPILQPTLRIVLRTVSQISSETKQSSSTKYLLQYVCEEINQSVTAALVGLSFVNARDIGLGCIASLRLSIKAHESRDDSVAVSLLKDLIIKVTKELRERHVIERRSNHTAQYAAYVEGDGEEDGENSKMVEQLILGIDSLPEDHPDFILYPDSLTSANDNDRNKTKAALGWSKYSGLGNALDSCFESKEKVDADVVLDRLSSFLNEWDAAVEVEKTEMVDLFDSDDIKKSCESSESQKNDAAGDAAVQYIELSSAEKQRLYEVEKIFASLVSQCESSAANLCWSRWLEEMNIPAESLEWEYSIGPKGGRDIYSRLGTCLIAPQFPKFIPDFLDNSTPDERRKSIIEEFFDGEFNLGGKVEILDITRKNFFDEDSCNSDDEGSFLSFPHPEIDKKQIEDKINDENDRARDENDPNMESNYNDTRALNDVQKDYNSASPPFPTYSTHACIDLSCFLHPPDVTAPYEAALTSSLEIEMYWDNVLHVRPEGSRKGVLLVTKVDIIIEYYDQYYESEIMAMEESKLRQLDAGSQDDAQDEVLFSINTFGRPNSCRFLINDITHAYLRRYRLRDSAMEMFFLSSGGSPNFIGSNSLFIDFGIGAEGHARRDNCAKHIMRNAPQNSVKQYPEKKDFYRNQLQKITSAWIHGSLSNFDYLMQLNILSGRSFNDLCQYPVMPWVLSNYHSTDIPDMNDPDNFRDLTKPMGALNEKRLAELIERFETFSDPTIPPFMYGSHYSTSAGVVLHFLVRLHPFAGLHRQLQSGHFDVADRLFCNVQRTWETCTGASVSEVKELTPEFYCNPSFLKNCNRFKLGTSQEGQLIDDVQLPPWADNSPEKFIEIMRCAMESNICSAMLPGWIDLIFGYKQRGQAAVQANNVFFYLTYYGSIDISKIPDEALRVATELQIAHFGQCPMQLFFRPHLRKLPLMSPRRRDCMSSYLSLWSHSGKDETHKLFQASPINHWLHLAAPPPGPHGDLICVRVCLGNRCVGIDSRGVFHFFQWAWKPEEDYQCFDARRDSSNFRLVPRLPLDVGSDNTKIAVAISHQLYLASSYLLVLSDADGCGGLGLQFVEPKKGVIKTETIISFIHSARISTIAMDSIGMTGGKYSKGSSGDIAIIGSEDGSATLWRFIFNSNIPLRPRLRMRGHNGQKIRSVAVNCRLNLSATVSKKKCCLFHLGNGSLVRSFFPPKRDDESDVIFADTEALCFSIQGYIVMVCQTYLNKKISYSLELFTLDGIHLGSHVLEPHRGLPRKMVPFADGKAVCVCCGCGVSIHRISGLEPLEELEEWRITDEEVSSLMNPLVTRKIPAVCDIDLYPGAQSIGIPINSRPYVAMAGCTGGALRIHALKGITEWAYANKARSVTSVVEYAFVKPASNTLKTAVGGVKGLGSLVFGLGKEIGKEVGEVIYSGSVASAGGAFVGGMLRKGDGRE